MNPETLLSGIREMISATVRMTVATNEEEKAIAGDLYSINERVISEQLNELYKTNELLAKEIIQLQKSFRTHSHAELQRY